MSEAAATDATGAPRAEAAVTSPVSMLLVALAGIGGALSFSGLIPGAWDVEYSYDWGSPITRIGGRLIFLFAALALWRGTRSVTWMVVAVLAALGILLGLFHGVPTALIDLLLEDERVSERITDVSRSAFLLIETGALVAAFIASRRWIGLPLAGTIAGLRIVEALGLVLAAIVASDREDLRDVNSVFAPLAAASLLTDIAFLALALGLPRPEHPDRGRVLRVLGGVGAVLVLGCALALGYAATSGSSNPTGTVTAALVSWPALILFALGGIGLARGGIPVGWALFGAVALQLVCCPLHVWFSESYELRHLQPLVGAADTLSLALVMVLFGVCLLLGRKMGLPGVSTVAAVSALLGALALLVATAIGFMDDAMRAYGFVLRELVRPFLVIALGVGGAWLLFVGRKPVTDAPAAASTPAPSPAPPPP